MEQLRRTVLGRRKSLDAQARIRIAAAMAKCRMRSDCGIPGCLTRVDTPTNCTAARCRRRLDGVA
jgi:hypothetical protein